MFEKYNYYVSVPLCSDQKVFNEILVMGGNGGRGCGCVHREREANGGTGRKYSEE